MAVIRGIKVYINLYDKWGNSVGSIELEPRVVDGLPSKGTRRGELVFNIQDSKIYYWDGSAWKKFAIDPHTHVRADITDFFSSPFWNVIPDKPSTFPPDPHGHSVGDIIFDGSVIPDADNTYDLGSSSLRWKSVHAKDYLIYTNAHFEHNKTDRLLSLLTKDALHDILLFRPPDVYEYDDGDGWVTGTVDDNIKSLFTGKRGYFAIPNGRVGVRFTWNGTIPNYVWYEIFFMKLISKTSGLRVVIEVSSDGSTWETILDEATDRWCNNFIARLDFNVDITKKYLRITLYPTWSSGQPPLVLYTIKMFNYNDVAWKPDLSQLFDWDFGKNLFTRSIMPNADNTYDLGSSSLRWKGIYVVNTYTGDVVFQNGWRITEFDENGRLMDSLRILDKNGEEMFKIAEDGLYFKGKKIA